MVFIAAAILAVCATKTCSILSVIAIPFLILALFGAGALFHLDSASYFDLLIAVLGYNAGLITAVVGALVIDRLCATAKDYSPRPISLLGRRNKIEMFQKK